MICNRCKKAIANDVIVWNGNKGNRFCWNCYAKVQNEKQLKWLERNEEYKRKERKY